ncbi:hypothetical protein M409DRAFT_48883 [Zasmidium cellare ATCC 36951]|uniref:Uncharacterized protein n=1 Tax=Zasmidium cellare ATCC 36951 TaxID=1080233 RepID=A0A6A6D4C5_ZASCE|nr:uncharacterized protein M409DRAFT_48883 [Zasmidium cellare ATCC 36951]KAF2173983.1 hypothetical protein M409DRAFT_48883 [Zasmidium cellare ATCC 36951]
MENLGLFGRLPGELRNQIYDMVLTHVPGQKASSALLRTCKQIYREGIDVLHHNSTFYVDFDVDYTTMFAVGDVYGYYFDARGRRHSSMPDVPRLRSSDAFFPPWSTKVRKWWITIDVSLRPVGLKTRLRREGDQAGYQKLRPGEEECGHVYQRALYPIMKIPQKIALTLNLENFEPGHVKFIQRTRLDNDAEITDLLHFDPLSEIHALENTIRHLLPRDPNPGKLLPPTPLQTLWAMSTAEFPSPHRHYQLPAYDSIADATLKKYIETLKTVLQLLKVGASEGMQDRWVAEWRVLGELGFNGKVLRIVGEGWGRAFGRLCVARAKLEVRGVVGCFDKTLFADCDQLDSKDTTLLFDCILISCGVADTVMSNISTSQTGPVSPSDMTLLSPSNRLDSGTTVSSQVAALALAPKDEPFTACFLSFNQTKTYSPLCHLTLTGALEATSCDPTSKTNIDILWPESLLRAPRIVVNIYLQDTEPTAWRHLSDFFAVYWFLESLAGFLGRTWKARRVEKKSHAAAIDSACSLCCRAAHTTTTSPVAGTPSRIATRMAHHYESPSTLVMAPSPNTAEEEQEVFRFFDLAPELRNRIYEYALVQNRFQKHFANTALLRVSKEVYREAAGIFWSQTTFCIRAHKPTRSTDEGLRDANFDFISGDMHAMVERSTLDRFVNSFPSAILKVARIEIKAPVCRPEIPNHLLYSLASILRRSSLKMQDLSIELEHGRDVELRLAYPLLRMPPHLNIFYHSSDKASEEQVRGRYLEGNKVKKLRPACTTFEASVEMKALRPKIEAYLKSFPKKPNSQKAGSDGSGKDWKLVGKYLKKADAAFNRPGTASLSGDRMRMAYVATLARWVEMREAGVRFGDEEVAFNNFARRTSFVSVNTTS